MKYYYKDLIEALWMNKSFGMKFSVFTPKIEGGKSYSLPGFDILKIFEIVPPHMEHVYKWVISEESLHLLKPIANDFVTYQAGGTQVCRLIRDFDDSPIPTTWKVIYREDKHFIWPEYEA